MNRIIGIVLGLCLSATLFGQGPDARKPESGLTVTGIGTVTFRPEGAKISFGIRASDNLFATAWKDNQVQTEKLEAAFEKIKNEQMQIKVSPPDVNQNDFNNNGGVVPNMVPGGRNDMPYNVSRTFQIVVSDRNLSQLQKQIARVIETALSHGANNAPNLPMNNNGLFGGGGNLQNGSITRVDFFSSDDSSARSSAYQKAVKAALKHARAAADGAGVKLGDILSITDQLEVNYNLGLPVIDPIQQQDVNGEIDLTVRVRVTFKI